MIITKGRLIMKLKDTNFKEFLGYVNTAKDRHGCYYVSDAVLYTVYDFCIRHHLRCEGRSLTVRWDLDNEPISHLSAGYWLDHQPTREELSEELFHEVWCKAEWASRCSRDKMELGYESVKAEFGSTTQKKIAEQSNYLRRFDFAVASGC